MPSVRFFIAVACDGLQNPLVLRALTPEIMAWGDHIWLLDLGPCLNYWKKKRKKRAHEQELLALLHATLCAALGETFREIDPSDFGLQQGATQTSARSLVNLGEDASQGATHVANQKRVGISFYAACAPHPFKALLLCAYMKECNIGGLLTWEQGLGSELAQKLSWSSWYGTVKKLFLFLDHKRNQGESLQRLLLLSQRLGLTSPQDMILWHAQGVRRRFGSILEKVWLWMFEDKTSTGLFADHDGFPWLKAELTEPMQVTRHLDEPVSLWSELQLFLQEDAQRLAQTLASGEYICPSDFGLQQGVTQANARSPVNLGEDVSQGATHIAGQKRVGILKLNWQVTLEDLTLIPIPINFRQPLDMMADHPLHAITLAQAEHSFEAVRESWMQDRDPPYPPIIGWTLTLIDSMLILAQEHSAFDSRLPLHAELRELARLHYELALPLFRYAWTEDISPEHNYQQEPIKVSQESSPLPSMAQLNRKRPLLVYKEPRPLPATEPLTVHFSESILCHWWEVEAFERHYYHAVDAQGRRLWVFRQGESYYLHGVYV